MEWFGTKGSAAPRTDSDIMDEAAGRARIEMAKQAKVKREKEKKELARKNAEMRKKLNEQRNIARTDDDLDDEEAGRMRAVLAAQSKARRAKEEANLDKQNASIFKSIRNTGVRTDDDIMDEAAGIKRLEMAAASKARKEQESSDLKAKNAAIGERLARVKPGVEITSSKGKALEEEGYFIRPYTFTQTQIDPTTMVRNPGDPPAPSWLGKYDKYDWTVPVVC